MRWLVCLLVLAACTTAYRVDPPQLSVLDPKSKIDYLTDHEGYTFTIDRRQEIQIKLANGRVFEGVVGDLQVNGPRWYWKNTPIEPTQVRSVVIEEPNVSGGVLALLTVLLLLTALVGGIGAG